MKNVKIKIYNIIQIISKYLLKYLNQNSKFELFLVKVNLILFLVILGVWDTFYCRFSTNKMKINYIDIKLNYMLFEKNISSYEQDMSMMLECETLTSCIFI